jgi:ribonuclease BN (tRNA processing enzyme)
MLFITCGGARGSAQTNHPDFLGFGGDTTCYWIESSAGDGVLLDLGSGVRNLAPILQAKRADQTLRILLSHFHLDHLSGGAHLSLLGQEKCRLEIHAPDHLATTAREAIDGLFGAPYWPVSLEDQGFQLQFHSFTAGQPPNGLTLGGLRVHSCATCHPGGSTAYRFEDLATGATAVIATDMEWGSSTAAERDALIALCATPTPAGLLIMDGQYDPSELTEKRGWGHSSWREAAELARHAGIRDLLVTHHDDRRDDTRLRAMEARLQREHPGWRMIRQGEQRVVTP